MNIFIVGIGVDGAKTLTLEAAEAIERADVLIGARRMLEPFRSLGKAFFEEYRSNEIIRYLAENSFDSAAVLMSGDCGFFSGARKLAETLTGFDVEVVSGISSAVYLFSKLKMDWTDCKFVSLHGKNGNIVRNVFSHKNTFFLLGGALTASDVCKRLTEYGMGYISVYIGSDLGYENEKIYSGAARDYSNIVTSELSVMLVVNPHYEQFLRSGICDNEFIRGNVPMTKSEVRTLVVSALNIGKNDICWDIGSGTGSVSIEMAMRCSDGKVYAVEKNSEALALIAENMRKFGCDNIEIVAGNAETAVTELPAPDCIFVGGSSGQLLRIIENAIKSNSTVRLVVTAVSLETLNLCTAIFDDLGIEAEITQISVTRTSKIGQHTMLRAENPVFIIKRKV